MDAEPGQGRDLSSARGNNDGSKELDAHAAEGANKLTANVGLTPNPLVSGASGDIDYTKATWTKATWTKATWTKATWTCVCSVGSGGVDPTKATWTKATWTTDWSK